MLKYINYKLKAIKRFKLDAMIHFSTCNHYFRDNHQMGFICSVFHAPPRCNARPLPTPPPKIIGRVSEHHYLVF